MAANLAVEFGDVLQTPGIFPTEQGKVNVSITNKGDAAFNGPVDLKLYASIDNVLDTNTLNVLGSPRGATDRLEGTDELLGTLANQNIQLAPGQSKTITVDFSQSEFRTPSVVSPGLYYLFAEVNQGNNTINSSQGKIITQGDVVIQWNSILLNAIADSGKGDALKGTPPPIAARNQAIVHAAIYDAVNAIDRSHKPYLVDISASEAAGASQEVAAVAAAHKALVDLFPSQKATFDGYYQTFLNSVPDGTAKTKGIQIGEKVATQIVNERQNDGSDINVNYKPGNGVGDWKPTFTDGETTNNDTDMKPAALPQWGLVTPFAIPSASQFRPDSLPEYSSPNYIKEYNEVKSLGAENSTTRNADQTEIAQFWAYDRDDTFRPPGQWNEIAQDVALAKGNSLAENARMFALLNLAQADAGIVAWDAKYTYEQFRPITAIREGDKDNNPETVADPNWEPLLDTPPFPDYISGHSVFGGASAQVLASFYGTDNISFDISSQELPGVSRSFGSFTQAANEDAISRIYGGIHINAATVDGVQVGKNVGDYVVDNFLT
ncbi:MAG: vanadium-dependent haloperoxidase [Calothrix sp. FI2-JRJ7]|jgi:hypothetical protein|nr:vanadium-dependent haloperoxidase [Calothrix sp. FI2-JRJ7]